MVSYLSIRDLRFSLACCAYKWFVKGNFETMFSIALTTEQFFTWILNKLTGILPRLIVSTQWVCFTVWIKAHLLWTGWSNYQAPVESNCMRNTHKYLGCSGRSAIEALKTNVTRMCADLHVRRAIPNQDRVIVDSEPNSRSSNRQK